MNLNITDANAGAKKLVGVLQPRRDVDGVAIGGVIEKPATAEIADERRPGVNANPCCTEIHAPGFPALAKLLSPAVEIMRAGDRPCGIIRLVSGCVEENLDRVADDFRNRTFMCEDNIGHAPHIFVEQHS